jgi:tetratricopeptide (TPR) repeat protein
VASTLGLDIATIPGSLLRGENLLDGSDFVRAGWATAGLNVRVPLSLRSCLSKCAFSNCTLFLRFHPGEQSQLLYRVTSLSQQKCGAFGDAASLYQVQAIAMLNLQKYDSAIEAYTSALRFDPDNAKVHLERGKLYPGNRALTHALTDFNIAIRLNPNIGDAYYCRALVHQELGDKENADADFNSAEELEIMLTPWSAPGTR